MAYLNAHPPARKQFISPRRAKPTGAVVVHTAEGMPDTIGPDDGAERVADWMTRRPDPGSYHTLIDSDGPLEIVELGDEAFHDGTGGNRWSTSISFATKAALWSTLPAQWVTDALGHAARAAVRHSFYVHSVRGFHIPARRITAAQYRSGIAGFVSHGQLDPGRRTDPGDDFPWDRFLALYADELAKAVTPPVTEDPDTMIEDRIIKAFLDGGRDPKLVGRDEVWGWRVEAIRTGRLDDVCAFIAWTEAGKRT